MSQSHWELVVRAATAIWPLATLLLGIFIGAYLSNRNQRKQWVADNKVQEYRELVSILTRAFNSLLNRYAPRVAYAPEERRAFDETQDQVLMAITDRIFIAKEITEGEVLHRWQTIKREFEENRDVDAFSKSFGTIIRDLLSKAARLWQ